MSSEDKYTGPKYYPSLKEQAQHRRDGIPPSELWIGPDAEHEPRAKIGESERLSNAAHKAYKKGLREGRSQTTELTDAVIDRLWQRAESREVVNAVIDVIEEATGYHEVEYAIDAIAAALTALIGPRPAEQENDDAN